MKIKQIILMYKEMIQALFEEKDSQPAIRSILNCCDTTESADIKQRGTKRTRNQSALLKLKKANPGKVKTRNNMNLGEDIKTFFKLTTNNPKILKTFPEMETVIILD